MSTVNVWAPEQQNIKTLNRLELNIINTPNPQNLYHWVVVKQLQVTNPKQTIGLKDYL